MLRGGIGYGARPNHTYSEVHWELHPPLLTHQEFIQIEQQLAVNRRLWGFNTTARPRLLTGLCVCGHCGRRMAYAGTRSIPSVLCKVRGCAQQHRSTREAPIALAITEALSQRSEDLAKLAATREEPPEVLVLRQQIAALERQDDADLLPAIEAKRTRLAAMLAGPTPEQAELQRLLADPTIWQEATRDELRSVFQQLVERVVIAKQAVEQVVLRV